MSHLPQADAGPLQHLVDLVTGRSAQAAADWLLEETQAASHVPGVFLAVFRVLLQYVAPLLQCQPLPGP